MIDGCKGKTSGEISISVLPMTSHILTDKNLWMSFKKVGLITNGSWDCSKKEDRSQYRFQSFNCKVLIDEGFTGAVATKADKADVILSKPNSCWRLGTLRFILSLAFPLVYINLLGKSLFSQAKEVLTSKIPPSSYHPYSLPLSPCEPPQSLHHTHHHPSKTHTTNKPVIARLSQQIAQSIFIHSWAWQSALGIWPGWHNWAALEFLALAKQTSVVFL